MRLVYPWLCDFVRVPGDPESIAHEMGLRGFEVAAVEHGRLPVIDFEITANRPDCLSQMGLAREASAIWGLPLQMPEMGMPLPDESARQATPIEVAIEAPDLCPRYCAQVFEVQVGPSPDWLRDRLEAAGVRPISNVVDVTNYVMLELGQPMHAFDVSKLAGSRLVIRRAREGERLTTLDGTQRTLTSDVLVIADAERATAIGGVMGGADSEIDSTTARIALESAYFQPATIRRTSRRLGLKTEASSRFERGADVNAPPAGIARAAALFRAIGAGRPIGPLVDQYPSPRRPLQIRLRASRLVRVLGQEIPPEEVPRILTPLGFLVAEGRDASDTGWLVTVPTFRVDVTREVDLVEEVGRHYGFDRLPVSFPALEAPQAPPAAGIARDRRIRQALTAAGFSESMTFAFIERDAALPFCGPGTEPWAIANPLSEKFAVLRPSMLPGLVDSCAYNRRRGRKDVRLFETSSRFTAAGETRAVGIAWSGAAIAPHWSGEPRAVDFFDIKGVVEHLAAAFQLAELEFTATERHWLVRGRAAEVHVKDRVLGTLGQLVPAIAEARGFASGEELYVAEIDSDALIASGPTGDLRVETLPRFPSVVRDISILVDEALPAGTVRGTIRSASPSTLVSIAEFDRYQGKGVPDGRVSLSLRLTFRASDRTLTDEEVQEATVAVVEALRREHRAEQR